VSPERDSPGEAAPAGRPALGLGIDAGGTATRWRLAADGAEPVAGGTVEPLSGHIYSPEAEARARRIVAALAEAATVHGRPGAVVAGVTGLAREVPTVALLRGLLAGAFGLPEERVRVGEDMWIAYLAQFAPGEGYLVYSGTGSIGYFLDPDGGAVPVGGRGYLIDDAGSGFWIAREALRAVLRPEEEAPGSGWPTPLGRALAGRIGGTAWAEVRAFVYGGDRGRIGSLAPAVADAALEGDADALRILGEAGRELARLALSLIHRLGPRPVALAGGSARLHPRIAETFRAALPAAIPVLARDRDAALTAAHLAARMR
jgi:glucosamine kinase